MTETSQMNTFPVLHEFIVNVKLSAGWIDLLGKPYINICLHIV